MENIDLKDRKILYELDLNARQSDASIGRKVDLSKDVVNRRIRKLIEKGVIKNFYTIVDATRLGYISGRFIIKFQHDTPEKEIEMINLLVSKPYTWWIGRIEGQRDLCFTIWAKDTYDLYDIIREIQQEFKWLIKDFVPGIYAKFYQYRRAYLLNKQTNNSKPVITCFREVADFDQTDINLLKIIAADARIRTTDIASRLHVTSDTVRMRLKKLIDKKIIQGFRAALDLRKLGYLWYKIQLDLEDVSKISNIIHYAHSHPNIVYAYEVIGGYDLELELEVENYEQFKKILNEIRDMFSKEIRYCDHFLFSEEFKIIYMPMTV
jgi:Lrp/AsnC family transcriptional regulator for asnA, asnC and gidA